MQNKIHRATNPFVLRNSIRLLFGLLTGIVGLVNMLTAIFPRPGWDILLGDWPLDTHQGAHKLLAKQFVQELGKLHIAYQLDIVKGSHSWKVWQVQIFHALLWLHW